MAACSPQRYVGNEGNVVRLATLTPSSVLPVDDKVLKLPAVRYGTGDVSLTGPYSGTEEATYDVEVVDVDADEQVVTAVVPAGVGSGTLTDIVASGLPQTYTVELQNDGIPTLAAGVAFEGVRIVAREVGAPGNDLSLEIDQAPVVHTPQAFSLLSSLQVGEGGVSTGVTGAAYDWDTKVLSADNIIPADAHRVSFAGDESNIYLAYKRYDGTQWTYHFVPAIRRAVPRETVVNFVTGGRTVTVRDLGVVQETYTNIVTAYDLLNNLKTTSALLDVSGVVAYDRSPTGQASRELTARTDAHVEPSSGTGSAAAVGFVDTFANANAATELVTATCVAVSSQQHPLAHVGEERWRLRGSVTGDLDTIVTGVPFTDPAGKFGLTIPVKLPPNYGQPVGRFTVSDIQYVSRDEELEPPICVVAMKLGPEAVDQTVTLEWTKRPSGDCLCDKMPIPRISARCLGLVDAGEGGTLSYQDDTIAALGDLYAWYAATVEERSAYTAVAIQTYGSEDLALGNPQSNAGALIGTGKNDPAILDSLKDLIEHYEDTIALIDPLDDTDPYRAAGFSAWDAAVDKLKYDVDAQAPNLVNLPSERYKSLLDVALISAGISPLGKTDASIVESGDGCWHDMGGDYWTVVGSGNGSYAPTFNGTVYYSSRLALDGKKYFSTKEFAFQLNIKCPGLLVYGDRIILSIGGAGTPTTYQTGDTLVLPVIAAQPLQLAGGQTGNAILDFYVSGSVDGAFPAYSFNPAAPAPYYEAGALTFLYVAGGIPNRKGDRWTFATEGGHYRWRKDGGAWEEDSPLPSISSTPAAFDSGLLITWIPGASPSFEVGDVWSFRALQPWAVSNVRTPNASKWRWTGTTPDLVVDAGAIVDIPGAVIARHTIPFGATITLEGGDAPGVYLWSETLTWNEDVIAKEFDVAHTGRYLRLSLTGAGSGGIGWAWAGIMLSTSLSADVEVRDSYKIENGSTGLDEGGRYFAQAVSGEVTFTEAALTEADRTALRALIKWAKTHNDEPTVVIPNINRPEEAHLVQVAVDQLVWKELSDYNADPAIRARRFDITIPLSGVWRA